jgi:hypothetical protein
MRIFIAIVALIAMVGMSGAMLGPSATLSDFGHITIDQSIMTIDLGQVNNVEVTVQHLLDALNTQPVSQQQVNILVNGMVFVTTHSGDPVHINERVKKTDHLGTYHFKSLVNAQFNSMSGPYSQSLSNIEDN